MIGDWSCRARSLNVIDLFIDQGWPSEIRYAQDHPDLLVLASCMGVM